MLYINKIADKLVLLNKANPCEMLPDPMEFSGISGVK